jgi:3-methyladenine DNA glycosylase AlkD
MSKSIADLIRRELKAGADPEKAAFLPGFFKALPGGYGEGDLFLGVTVPLQRKIARAYYREIELPELQQLLRNQFHECRLTALFILILKYEKAKRAEDQQHLVNYYLGNIDYVNNWDLVDSSAYKILGPHLEKGDRRLLYDLARSGHLWRQRVAIISTLHFIRSGDFNDTLKLSEILLDHEHDLIHKAVGWMLREVGNRDFKTEYKFLKRHYQTMPRTALRYAIEKFDPALRKQFMSGSLVNHEVEGL